MAKKAKQEEDSLESVVEDLQALLARLEALSGVEAEEVDEEEEVEEEADEADEDGEESEEDEEGEFPTAEEISAMSKEELAELAEAVGLDSSVKPTARKKLLLSIAKFQEDGELSPAEAKALVTAFGSKPSKKHDENIEALQDLFADEEGEEEVVEEVEEKPIPLDDFEARLERLRERRDRLGGE